VGTTSREIGILGGWNTRCFLLDLGHSLEISDRRKNQHLHPSEWKNTHLVRVSHATALKYPSDTDFQAKGRRYTRVASNTERIGTDTHCLCRCSFSDETRLDVLVDNIFEL